MLGGNYSIHCLINAKASRLQNFNLPPSLEYANHQYTAFPNRLELENALLNLQKHRSSSGNKVDKNETEKYLRNSSIVDQYKENPCSSFNIKPCKKCSVQQKFATSANSLWSNSIIQSDNNDEKTTAVPIMDQHPEEFSHDYSNLMLSLEPNYIASTSELHKSSYLEF